MDQLNLYEICLEEVEHKFTFIQNKNVIKEQIYFIKGKGCQ